MYHEYSELPNCRRYEAARRHAETLQKLSLEHIHHQTSIDTDRGHITTILEHDDTMHPLSDRSHHSFTDTARDMLDEYDASQELDRANSMSSQRILPRVRTTRTADHAAQVAIAGNRQNSLPDLPSARRAPRPRAAAVRKNSAGVVRLDSQVPSVLDFCLGTSACLLPADYSLLTFF